jgi:drug/metabolite transporter (DMT)-like permease
MVSCLPPTLRLPPARKMTGPSASARPALWMISGAFSLAIMSTLTHALATRCDWMTIAFVRVAFMFVSAVVAARVAGTLLVFSRPRTLWVRSLAGSFSLVCNFYALTRLPVGDVITLTNTYPLWIIALTWLAARRAPVAGDLLGVLVGVAGVALVGRPHLSGNHLAAAVALISSVSSAIAMIGLHKLRGIDARAVVAHFAGVACVVAGLGYGFRLGVSPMSPAGIDTVTVILLVGVGLTGTIGQVLLTKAYAAGAPTRISVLALTQVVFALILDVVVWNRPIPAASLLGSVLIVAPTAWILAKASGLGKSSTSSPVDS